MGCSASLVYVSPAVLAVDSATGTTETGLAAGHSDLVSTFRSSRSAGSGTLTVRKDGHHKLEVTVENQ